MKQREEWMRLCDIIQALVAFCVTTAISIREFHRLREVRLRSDEYSSTVQENDAHARTFERGAS